MLRIRTPERTNRKTMWQLTKVQQTNFTFFEVYEISVEKKKNLWQLRGMENSRRMSPKYRNGHGRHTEIILRTTKKEPADNVADYVLKIYPLTKKWTRKNGVKNAAGQNWHSAACRVPLQTNYHSGKTSRTMLRRKRFHGSTVFGGAAPNRCLDGRSGFLDSLSVYLNVFIWLCAYVNNWDWSNHWSASIEVRACSCSGV